ncbi:MAG TPA: hypothetical protein VM733_22170 [Thermoanaerobaculia bacterium]|nr:hypothetical protein [Thermoanaerobaculia bacterium]
MNIILPIHIAAGGAAILLGATALIAKKGGRLHRRSGLLFVYAMLVMGFGASILGLMKSPTDPNVRSGFMVAYFVVTALMTVRPATRWTRAIQLAWLAVALTLAAFAIVGGVRIFNLPGRTFQGIPFFAPLIIGVLLLLAAIGDVRVLRFGVPRGGRRLARHLWRMCFALFIAAGSFFSIRERVAKILPEPFTTAPMRALPILLLFGAMFYWLWRVRFRSLDQKPQHQ